MATKKVTTKPKVESKTEKLNPLVWEIPFNADLVAQVLSVQQTNARVGTANAKTRAEVRGGGRKLWKQKVRARARAGSIRSPLWKKGGVTFGPSNRVWVKKINKKMSKKAVCVMLSERLRKENLSFVNITQKEELKAIREKMLKELGQKSSMIITDDQNVAFAMSNVKKINVVNPKDLNLSSLVKARNILVENKSIKSIEERLLNEK